MTGLLCALLSSTAPGDSGEGLVLNIDGASAIGERFAKVAIVEFSDYQCPMCNEFFRVTLRQIEEEYLDTGKLRYVFRDFPLESMHPLALRAAEAAHCAGDQEKYWKMHDRLFRNQTTLEDRFLLLHARRLALNVTTFEQCLESGKHTARVRNSVAEGKKAGVKGTPWFFLGITDASASKMRVVTIISGAQPFSVFKEAIDKLLARP